MLLQKIDGSEVCCKKEVCSSLLKLVVAFIVVKWEKQEKRTERETSLLCLSIVITTDRHREHNL